jgi:hypothetical protein
MQSHKTLPPRPPGAGKHWTACEAEIQKFRSNSEKGKGKMRACLNKHTADLTDACKTSMAAHDAKAKEQEKSGNDYGPRTPGEAGIGSTGGGFHAPSRASCFGQ